MQEFIIRRAPRYPVSLPVTELNGQPADNCLVLDISAWGSLLQGSFPLQAGDPVEFSFAMPDNSLWKLAGQVEWMRPALHKDGWFLMGVSFAEANWDLDKLGQEMYFT